MNGRWRPYVTVAGVIERGGRYLLVEEERSGRRCLNQPAGHWEADESLLQAVCREVREETGWPFQPQALVGVYRWDAPRGVTYLRFAIAGTVNDTLPQGPLDAPVVATCWLTPEEIAHSRRLRSPLVWRCVEDHLAGRRLPLSALVDLAHPA